MWCGVGKKHVPGMDEQGNSRSGISKQYSARNLVFQMAYSTSKLSVCKKKGGIFPFQERLPGKTPGSLSFHHCPVTEDLEVHKTHLLCNTM